MRKRSTWTRRDFVQGAGALMATGVGQTASARASFFSPQPVPRYAYVGSTEGAGSIHVFAVEDGRWTPLQVVQSPQPAAFAFHPLANVLYVANQVSTWQGLPRGSVEAYRVDPAEGTLTKLGHQPLSLSATLPTDLSVSPDGRYLVVAAYGGGAYNLFPLGPKGELERVASIVKETGCGPHQHHQRAAHPHTVLFDPAGKYLLGSDMGADRVSSFRLDEGSLERKGQASLSEGSGPSHMVFHPLGHVLFVYNQLLSSITGFAYDAVEGRVGHPIWSESLSWRDGVSPSLAIHPSGQFLYASGQEIAAWRIDSHIGELRRMPQPPRNALSASQLTMGPDGRFLYMLHEHTGEVRQARIDLNRGGLYQQNTMARVPRPRSLLFGPSFAQVAGQRTIQTAI